MRLYRLSIILFWILSFYILTLSHVKHSEGLRFAFKKNVNFILPQGWGFFTRNPREAHFEIYEVSGKNGELQKLLDRNTSIRNLFGLSKNNRYIGYELSKLIGYVPREAWQNGVGFVSNHIPDSAHVLKVDLPLQIFDTENDYLIVQQKPIPYAWASREQEQYRPFLAARIRLSLDKEDGSGL